MFRLYGAVLLSKGRRPPGRLYPGDSDHLRASVLGSALQRARMNPPQLESGRLCAWIGASPATVELATLLKVWLSGTVRDGGCNKRTLASSS